MGLTNKTILDEGKTVQNTHWANFIYDKYNGYVVENLISGMSY